jgi:hypothetical protein
MNSIKGSSNTLKNIPALLPENSIKAKKETQVTGKMAQSNSMEQSLNKIAQNITAPDKKELPLSEKISSVLKKGNDYFKEVKNKAIDDRAKGIKMFDGANKYLNELNKQVDAIGRKAQDQILDNLTLETGKLLQESIKGSKLEKYVSDLLPLLKKKGGNTGSLNSKAAASTKGVHGTLGKAAGAFGAAYSLYQLYKGFGKDSPVASAANGATAGAYIGTMIVPGLGTTIGGIVGGIGGALLGVFGKKKKDPERIARDQMREAFKQSGFLDKDSTIGLADGSRFSLAIDGKATLDSINGDTRYGYHFDPSNPMSGVAIGMLQPLATVLTGGDETLSPQLTGYLVNAVTSNATTLDELRDNTLAIYAQSGASLETIAEAVTEMTDRNMIPAKNLEAFIGGIMSVADAEVLYAISEGTTQNSNLKQDLHQV